MRGLRRKFHGSTSARLAETRHVRCKSSTLAPTHDSGACIFLPLFVPSLQARQLAEMQHDADERIDRQAWLIVPFARKLRHT